MPLRLKNGCVKAGSVKKSNVDILADGIKKASIECKDKKDKKNKQNNIRKYIIF